VGQILSMMQDTGNKEPINVGPASLVDFSFLREAQKQLKPSANGHRR
jgi:hypothetical protein